MIRPSCLRHFAGAAASSPIPRHDSRCAGRRLFFLFAALAASALLAACSASPRAVPGKPAYDAAPADAAVSGPGFDQPLLILVSLDGFHPDYLQRGLTPTLNRLAAEGTRARWLEPSFPSKTFPNHYSLVTGLVPDHHGIVDNTMLDPELGRFSLRNRDAVSDPRWWGGEPIWNGACRQAGAARRCSGPAARRRSTATIRITGCPMTVHAH